MRTLLIATILLLSTKLFAQTQDELNIQNLSATIFRLEVENKIDSLENVIHEKFIAVSSNGSIQTKTQYLDKLKGGNFVHNKIEVEENKSTVSQNTATIIGKGKFTITASGQTNTIHLSYMEVFIRLNKDSPWQIFALKANVLDK
jgi:hypothetical protein